MIKPINFLGTNSVYKPKETKSNLSEEVNYKNHKQNDKTKKPNKILEWLLIGGVVTAIIALLTWVDDMDFERKMDRYLKKY